MNNTRIGTGCVYSNCGIRVLVLRLSYPMYSLSFSTLSETAGSSQKYCLPTEPSHSKPTNQHLLSSISNKRLEWKESIFSYIWNRVCPCPFHLKEERGTPVTLWVEHCPAKQTILLRFRLKLEYFNHQPGFIPQTFYFYLLTMLI